MPLRLEPICEPVDAICTSKGMRLVFIYGPVASGKLTIARHLAERLGAQLADNHTLINPAEALFARGADR